MPKGLAWRSCSASSIDCGDYSLPTAMGYTVGGKIGQVQLVLTGDPGDSRVGHGFSLQDDLGRFCMMIAYASEAEADAAAIKFREAMDTAMWTRCQRS